MQNILTLFCPPKPNLIQSNPIQSNPIQSNPIQSAPPKPDLDFFQLSSNQKPSKSKSSKLNDIRGGNGGGGSKNAPSKTHKQQKKQPPAKSLVASSSATAFGNSGAQLSFLSDTFGPSRTAAGAGTTSGSEAAPAAANAFQFAPEEAEEMYEGENDEGEEKKSGQELASLMEAGNSGNDGDFFENVQLMLKTGEGR